MSKAAEADLLLHKRESMVQSSIYDNRIPSEHRWNTHFLATPYVKVSLYVCARTCSEKKSTDLFLARLTKEKKTEMSY